MRKKTGSIGRFGAPLFALRLAVPLAGLMTWGAVSVQGSPGAPANAAAATKSSSALHLAFTDIQGKSYGSDAVAAHKASIFLFVSAECPVSNAYTSRFISLAHDYSAKGVQVFAVYSNRQESLAGIKAHSQQRKFDFPVIRDAQNQLADRLGAVMTPQAILVDASGAVRYRGRIDDNAVPNKATTHDLKDALDAVLAGNPVPHAKTMAFGCAIRRNTATLAVAKGVPTYASQVAPILQAKCESCHRTGEVAPFSLQNYKQASAWAADIKRYTQNGYMPPWKPAPGYGELRDTTAHSLSDKERAILASWADAGAPLGDPKKIPAPRKYTTGWQLGEPDMTIMPSRAYQLAADGDDVYRNFVIKTNFTEDRFLNAVEVRPGNRAVVHHVIVYIDGMGVSDQLEGKDHDGQPGYTSFGGPGFVPTGMLGGWAPGNDPNPLPDGVGARVPKNARLVIQVHYHKDGKPETDLTKIGLHFSRTTIDKQVNMAFAINTWFHIPPGADHHEVTATSGIGTDVHVLSVTPHMHLLGRDIKVWATLPDGSEKPMVWIKDWDFNWQASYYFKEPIALPKGSKVHLIAYYDNSDKNPRNPSKDHSRTVGWGEATTDEMCIAFFTTTKDAEHLAYKPANVPTQVSTNTVKTAK